MNIIKPDVAPKKISDITTTILSPALTSHFSVKFRPPQSVIDFINVQGRFEGSNKPENWFTQTELDKLSILCSEATLPGSSLFTSEVTNDFPGVTEKMVYRRQYDDQSSFTFYVDQNYRIVEFLEGWINFIVNEDDREKYNRANASYRMKFRNDYAGEMAISKFERNIGQVINRKSTRPPSIVGTRMDYNFVKAFPISIDSMPVSYENGTVLKCIVNFTYIRYIRIRVENNTTK